MVGNRAIRGWRRGEPTVAHGAGRGPQRLQKAADDCEGCRQLRRSAGARVGVGPGKRFLATPTAERRTNRNSLIPSLVQPPPGGLPRCSRVRSGSPVRGAPMPGGLFGSALPWRGRFARAHAFPCLGRCPCPDNPRRGLFPWGHALPCLNLFPWADDFSRLGLLPWPNALPRLGLVPGADAFLCPGFFPRADARPCPGFVLRPDAFPCPGVRGTGGISPAERGRGFAPNAPFRSPTARRPKTRPWGIIDQAPKAAGTSPSPWRSTDHTPVPAATSPPVPEHSSAPSLPSVPRPLTCVPLPAPRLPSGVGPCLPSGRGTTFAAELRHTCSTEHPAVGCRCCLSGRVGQRPSIVGRDREGLRRVEAAARPGYPVARRW